MLWPMSTDFKTIVGRIVTAASSGCTPWGMMIVFTSAAADVQYMSNQLHDFPSPQGALHPVY